MLALGVTYHFASDPAQEPVPVATHAAPAPQIGEKAAWAITGPSFAFDSSTLTPEHEQAMQPALERLKSYPQAILNIVAHTDSRGSDDYNQRLSELRAESVREYFIAHGVQPNQLTATGMGESHPVADNNTEEGRYQNRRVELESPAFNVDTTVPGGRL